MATQQPPPCIVHAFVTLHYSDGSQRQASVMDLDVRLERDLARRCDYIELRGRISDPINRTDIEEVLSQANSVIADRLTDDTVLGVEKAPTKKVRVIKARKR